MSGGAGTHSLDFEAVLTSALYFLRICRLTVGKSFRKIIVQIGFIVQTLVD